MRRLAVFTSARPGGCTALIAAIPDSQLSASSVWSPETADHGVDRSRLGTIDQGFDTGIGAFATAVNQADEWIQADLGSIQTVSKIATQGRNQGLSGTDHDQWVTSYKLAYSNDGSSFTYILNDDDSERVFTGNSDADTIVEHTFTAIYARYVRLYAQTWNNHISLRWELYDCGISSLSSVEPSYNFIS